MHVCVYVCVRMPSSSALVEFRSVLSFDTFCYNSSEMLPVFCYKCCWGWQCLILSGFLKKKKIPVETLLCSCLIEFCVFGLSCTQWMTPALTFCLSSWSAKIFKVWQNLYAQTRTQTHKVQFFSIVISLRQYHNEQTYLHIEHLIQISDAFIWLRDWN